MKDLDVMLSIFIRILTFFKK